MVDIKGWRLLYPADLLACVCMEVCVCVCEVEGRRKSKGGSKLNVLQRTGGLCGLFSSFSLSQTAERSLPLGLLPCYVHPLPPNSSSLFLSLLSLSPAHSHSLPTTASFKGVCLFLKAESVTVPSSHVHFALGLC